MFSGIESDPVYILPLNIYLKVFFLDDENVEDRDAQRTLPCGRGFGVCAPKVLSRGFYKITQASD